MVIVRSSNLMSMPTYLHGTRSMKEKYLHSAIEEFTKEFNSSSINSLPTVIKTTYADIGLNETKKGKSYFGITAMKEAICEPSEYKDRIKYDVLQKAGKSRNWIEDELNKPYVVAIDDNSSFFYRDRYNIDLFGNATCYCQPLKVPEIEINSEIETAINNGWKEYLRKMCVLPNNRSVISENERGLFFTDQVVKNVSAVLVKHAQMFHIFANPLAEKRINNAAILQDFEDCVSGWE